MSDLNKIKKELKKEDNLNRLLEHIGCELVEYEQRGTLITAKLPIKFNSNNRRSVQVRLNKSLTCYIRSRNDFEGDIFSLVSYIQFDRRGDDIQKGLSESKNFICNLFNWKQFLSNDNGSVIIKDYASSLKEIIGEKGAEVEIKSNDVLSEDIMEQFYFYGKPLPYKKWIEEGISYNTQIEYGVGFCLQSKRVVFPIRNRFGKLVGVKGRIMKDEDDDRKYLYIYSCNNGYEWFNFHRAHVNILLNKRVYIFESEKSSMMSHTNGVYNTLAIGASDISEQQAKIIKDLGSDIEIVLCYDKDKTIEEIKSNAKLFRGRKIYGMFDVDNLLKEKDSPTDKGIEVWNRLVENNIYEIY